MMVPTPGLPSEHSASGYTFISRKFRLRILEATTGMKRFAAARIIIKIVDIGDIFWSEQVHFVQRIYGKVSKKCFMLVC